MVIMWHTKHCTYLVLLLWCITNVIYGRSDDITRQVCQFDSLKLKCGVNLVIKIIRAIYGRRSPKICSRGRHLGQINCGSPTSLRKARELCEKKKCCTLYARNSMFGNPCGGVQKYLDVTYRCVAKSPIQQIISRLSRFGMDLQHERRQMLSNYIPGPDGRRYRFHTERMTWHQAGKTCEAEQAHLAFDDNPVTHQYITTNYVQYSRWWIGALKNEEGGFDWLDGRPVTQTYWSVREPDDNGMGKKGCVQTNYEMITRIGNWNEQHCLDREMFLCQREGEFSNPPPPSLPIIPDKSSRLLKFSRCNGEYNDCCKDYCLPGQQGCDADDQCADGLVCGKNNCPWNNGVRCCIEELIQGEEKDSGKGMFKQKMKRATIVVVVILAAGVVLTIITMLLKNLKDKISSINRNRSLRRAPNIIRRIPSEGPPMYTDVYPDGAVIPPPYVISVSTMKNNIAHGQGGATNVNFLNDENMPPPQYEAIFPRDYAIPPKVLLAISQMTSSISQSTSCGSTEPENQQPKTVESENREIKTE